MPSWVKEPSLLHWPDFRGLISLNKRLGSVWIICIFFWSHTRSLNETPLKNVVVHLPLIVAVAPPHLFSFTSALYPRGAPSKFSTLVTAFTSRKSSLGLKAKIMLQNAVKLTCLPLCCRALGVEKPSLPPSLISIPHKHFIYSGTKRCRREVELKRETERSRARFRRKGDGKMIQGLEELRESLMVHVADNVVGKTWRRRFRK